MSIVNVYSVLESSEVAYDVLFANTPKDMLSRARFNKKVREIIVKSKTEEKNLVELLLNRFEIILNEKPTNNLLAIGTFCAYCALFYESQSSVVYNKLAKLLNSLDPNSFLLEIVLIVRKEIKKKINNSYTDSRNINSSVVHVFPQPKADKKSYANKSLSFVSGSTSNFLSFNLN